MQNFCKTIQSFPITFVKEQLKTFGHNIEVSSIIPK